VCKIHARTEPGNTETLLAGSTKRMQGIPFSTQVPAIARQTDWQSKLAYSRLTNHKDKRASVIANASDETLSNFIISLEMWVQNVRATYRTPGDIKWQFLR